MPHSEVAFSPTVSDALIPSQVQQNAKRGIPVIGPPDVCEGRTLAIAGSGPSLVEPAGYDEVWAVNRAANLVDCTHALTIEPSRVMCEVWRKPPDVTYFLASVAHPYFVDHLLAHGRNIAWFHSLQTKRQEEEAALYGKLFAKTCLSHTGMNGASRAVDLALWLGYSRIDLYGCDMAFGLGHEMYADGQLYDGGWWLSATIAGEKWRTKPDMLYTAIDLVKLDRPEVTFVGDTLPNALTVHPEALDLDYWTQETAA